MLIRLKQNIVLYFFLKAAILYSSWIGLYYYFLEPQTLLDERVISHIVHVSAFLLRAVGYSTFEETRDTTFQLVGIVGGINNPGVWIGTACNAISLFALFSIFIFSFPGSWKHKIWFIPMGLMIIHIANVLRVSLLAIIAFKNVKYLNFNHTYTFTILIYSIIFILWMWWINKFSKN
jgi:exosortase family protein XrtF